MATKPTAAKPTAAELAELLKLKREHRDLSSKARTREKRIGALSKLCTDYLEAQGKSEARLYQRFRLALVEGPRRPKWKDLFTAALGIRRASEVEQQTPPSQKLAVTEENPSRP